MTKEVKIIDDSDISIAFVPTLLTELKLSHAFYAPIASLENEDNNSVYTFSKLHTQIFQLHDEIVWFTHEKGEKFY